MENNPKVIQDYYQYEILERKLTTNTVIHRHANIRKCLQYAYRIGLINSNPADRVERPKKNTFSGSAYSEEELQELFRLFRGDPLEFAVITASFYGLRHSCASLLFSHGVSLKEIQEWLGHSNISTTANIYTHMNFNKKISSANAIIGLLGKEKESTSAGN